MPPKLRPFQAKLDKDIEAAWAAGAKNVMPVAATGSGKTVILSKKLNDEPGSSIAIAHRQELVSQISVALARNGVRHRVVGAQKGNALVRVITALQVAELGYSFLDPNARCGVGGVDTVIRMSPTEPWFQQIRLQVQDEGHHVLAANKWGKVAKMFPNARGLFPTATPLRADGKGLGRHADGLTDAMVLAPSMRDIINAGYLTDYRLICPPNNLDLSHVHTTPGGDFSPEEVKNAVAKSTVTGDVVKHYLQFARGKLGVTFCVDVDEAVKTAQGFRDAGIPAEVVSAKTPDTLRAAIIRKFKNRQVLQLVNVDLFGEGFDLPAIEVVSMARPTESFSLYSQQFGRALRLMLSDRLNVDWDKFSDEDRRYWIAASEKPKAIIIDHVNNIVRHGGPPDKPRTWTLDRRDKRASKKSDAIPLRVCVQCFNPYERIYKKCPYCDYYMPPAARGGPDFVDGDLTELDEAALARMRGEIARIDGDFKAPYGLDGVALLGARKQHAARQQGQATLRNAIAWWAGLEHGCGHSESESYRRFFFKFGIDVANAQMLGVREAEELALKVHIELGKFGIDGTVNAMGYFSS